MGPRSYLPREFKKMGGYRKTILKALPGMAGLWQVGGKVENVPAKVCQQCGEKLFDPQAVERLQKIIWDKQTPQEKIKIPIFDLSSV